jgi:hypothetical protein
LPRPSFCSTIAQFGNTLYSRERRLESISEAVVVALADEVYLG